MPLQATRKPEKIQIRFRINGLTIRQRIHETVDKVKLALDTVLWKGCDTVQINGLGLADMRFEGQEQPDDLA